MLRWILQAGTLQLRSSDIEHDAKSALTTFGESDVNGQIGNIGIGDYHSLDEKLY